MNEEKRNPTRKTALGSLLNDTLASIFAVAFVGFIVATLFTVSGPPGIFSGNLGEQFALVFKSNETPTTEWATPTPRPHPHIGIVVGHWGDDNDPGAVCQDGLTEFQVNQSVATLVQQYLNAEGFDVDLLKEFDPRLNGYQALALISIHADSCVYINDQATGFKVAASLNTPRPEKTARLTACIRTRYTESTNMVIHNSVTPDMSSYHAFGEINTDTPAVIIETGFLNLDRVMLTQNTDLVARGITNGILCYIYNEDISTPADHESGD
jgi:N-acetylmuramoyl-L-alanine amidase